MKSNTPLIRCFDVPESTPKPNRFVSPGLKRLLVRLALANTVDLDQLETRGGNTKALSALVAARGLEECEVLQTVATDLSLECAPWSDFEGANWSMPKSDQGELTMELATRNRIFPISYTERDVRVAFADPLDMEAIGEIEYLTKRRVRVVLASEGAILRAISAHFGAAHSKAAEEEFDSRRDAEIVDDEFRPDEGSGNGFNAPPIIKLVNRLMADAVGLKASDIHLVPTSTALEAKFRIDGVMSTHSIIPKKLQPYVITRLKLLAKMDIAERRRPQDGRFRMKLSDTVSRDVRASVVSTPFGETMVLRILGGSAEDLTFESLGLSPTTIAQLQDDLSATDQIVLVVGPTGSGKSTTLYSAIRSLNDGSNTIITVEDPIEYKIEGLTQMQVDPKVGITFASGLRSILRQDPDIVLVGEIRDSETAEISFQAAQTGHLVLSTLHTNDAPSTITRLFDLGVQPFIVADSLRGVLAQRLVRKVCSRCAKPAEAEEREKFEATYGGDSSGLQQTQGCDACDHTGYRGRIGVYSYLHLSPEIRELVRRRAAVSEIARLGRKNGMLDLGESALELVRTGKTTLEEAERSLGKETMRVSPRVGEVRDEAKTQTHAAVIDAGFSIEPARINAGAPVEGSIADLAAHGDETDEPKSTQRRILLVDDDKGVRAVLRDVLRKAGFDVSEAKDGRQALDAVMTNSPDVVVCDLIMPGVNGLMFLSELRRSEGAGRLPVLMLTGSDDERNELALIEAGADDFVSKSSSPAVVVARIKRLLARTELN